MSNASPLALAYQPLHVSQDERVVVAESSTIFPRRVQPDTPLQREDHIRLLRIDSACGSTVDCSLWEYQSPLSTIPGYAALSYCWGDQVPEHTITINGEPFRVTLNVRDALKYVAMFFEQPHANAALGTELCERLLWLDAVCLNQEDEEEKSAQIQRMGEIYSGAFRVLVSLGPGTNDTPLVMFVGQWLEVRLRFGCRNQDPFGEVSGNIVDRASVILKNHSFLCAEAIKFLGAVDEQSIRYFYNFFLSVYQLLPEGLGKMETEQLSEMASFLSLQYNVFFHDSSFWSAFLSLMDNPWYTRVWTLQEIAMARHASILCGGHSMDWDIYRILRKCFYNERWRNILFSDDTLRLDSRHSRDIFHDTWRTIPKIDKEQANGTGNFQYLLVQNFGVRKARDPRDTVYGLLGLLEPELRAKIRADYGLRASHVFSNAIKVISDEPDTERLYLSLMEFLETFGFAKTSLDPDLPTWCPDFSADLGGRDAIFKFSDMLADEVRQQLQAPVMPKISNQMQLEASVIVVDEVDYAASVAPPVELEHELRQSKDVLKVYRLWLNGYPSECQDWFRAMFNLINRCDVESSVEKIEWLKDRFLGSLGPGLKLDDISEVFRSGIAIGPNEGEKLLENIERQQRQRQRLDMDLCDQYSFVLFSLIGGRKKYFLSTRQGRIGFSLRPVKSGDRLCYIPGGNLLHILSPDCDRYITSACIHGLEGHGLLDVVGLNPEWTKVSLD